MLDNFRTKNQTGFTIVELVISIVVIGVLAGVMITIFFLMYGNTIRSSYQARLAVESQNILRTIVEELRVSAGIRATSMPDSHVVGGGASWSTNNDNLVLIVATPAVNSANDLIFNESAGEFYMNETVYYAEGNVLYKRMLAAPGATDNKYKTSCPPSAATAACPSDVVLSQHFKDMRFNFFDQDNLTLAQTIDSIPLARSIELNIDMERKVFGSPVTYNNKIRMTMRNNQL